MVTSRWQPICKMGDGQPPHDIIDLTSMISGRIGCELAALAVFCILAIFLFPAMQGPYSAVHGPASALQAARAATRLHTAIVQGARRAMAKGLIPPLVALLWTPRPVVDFESAALADGSIILRC